MHNDEPWPGAVKDDIDEFVEEAVNLYTNEEAWNKAQQNATPLLHTRYDSKILGPDLIETIHEAMNDLEQHRLNNFTGAMLKHHTMASTKYMSQWIEAKNKTI